MADGFTELVAGAVIAGLVGLSAVWVQQWMQNRQLVNDQVLGPVYSFLVGLLAGPLDDDPANPWNGLTPYQRIRVGARLRRRIQEFSDRYAEWNVAGEAFRIYIYDHRNNLIMLLKSELNAHLDTQGQFPLNQIGISGGGAISLDYVHESVSRSLVRYIGEPDKAWAELDSPKGTIGPYRSLVGPIFRELRIKDPDAVRRIQANFATLPSMSKARELLAVADGKRGPVMTSAKALRDRLAGRLT